MPTASHLFSAVIFAVIAWFASELAKPLMPDGTQFGLFSEINAALAAWLGWKMVGSRAKAGLRASVSAGIGTAVALFVLATALHCFAIMIKRSTADRYDDPVEALTAAVGMMWEFGEPALTPEIVGLLLVGGFGAGLMSALVARVWP